MLARQTLAEKLQAQFKLAKDQKLGGSATKNRVTNAALKVNEMYDPTPKPHNYAEINRQNKTAGGKDNRILRYGAIREGTTPGEGIDTTPAHIPGQDNQTQKIPNVPVISFNIAEFL